MSDQLQDALPVGLEIEADGPDVVVRFALHEGRNGTAAILDDDDGRSFVERLETATRAVLSHVQDAAAAASSTPWPSTSATLPLPYAEVVDGRLRAWFGNRNTPDLRLQEVETITLLTVE